MMLHRMMFSNWCLNILLLSLFASNFFTKHDDLHSIASLRHQTSFADHCECLNQAFKASNVRNLNKNFQKLKQVINAFYLNKHEYWALTWLEIASIGANLQMQKWNLMIFANSKWGFLKFQTQHFQISKHLVWINAWELLEYIIIETSLDCWNSRSSFLTWVLTFATSNSNIYAQVLEDWSECFTCKHS